MSRHDEIYREHGFKIAEGAFDNQDRLEEAGYRVAIADLVDERAYEANQQIKHSQNIIEKMELEIESGGPLAVPNDSQFCKHGSIAHDTLHRAKNALHKSQNKLEHYQDISNTNNARFVEIGALMRGKIVDESMQEYRPCRASRTPYKPHECDYAAGAGY